MKDEDDFSIGSAFLIFFLVILLGVATLNGTFYPFKEPISVSVPEEPAHEKSPSVVSSKEILLPEEKRPLALIPLLELPRLFHSDQRKFLDSEIERFKHDSNALIRIVSLKKMGMNGTASADSEASQIWNLSVSQIKDLIAQKQTSLTLLLQFQEKLEASSLPFASNPYLFEAILEEIRCRPLQTPSEPPAQEEVLIELARKIAETCIPSKQKGY